MIENLILKGKQKNNNKGNKKKIHRDTSENPPIFRNIILTIFDSIDKCT